MISLEQLDALLRERLDQLAARFTEAAQQIQATQGRVEELVERIQALDAQVRASLESSDHAAAEARSVAAKLSARPYMASEIFGSATDLDEPMGYRDDVMAPAAVGAAGFADVFRGPETLIRERQRVYAPLFQPGSKVVDIACGRGEFLALMAEAGATCIGVDNDHAMVQRCRDRGLEAVEGDALAYLEDMADESLDGVFCAQFIEHLDSATVEHLLGVIRRCLRPTGVAVLETVNPECHEAFKTFHVDPTHHAPIFPQVLLHLLRTAGFHSARVFYPVAGGFTQLTYATAGEYAVIASPTADPPRTIVPLSSAAGDPRGTSSDGAVSQ